MLSVPTDWHQWITGGLVLGAVVVLTSGRFGADIVFMGVLAALAVLGILEPTDAIAGFASPAVITVGLLYVVSAGMKQTGATQMLASRLLGNPKTVRSAQARLTLPVAAVSAFVNNTPIVAMFLPVLTGVAKRGGFSASKLYMPLSFASILGGVCTLIGTSTNVVVAQLVAAERLTDEQGEPIRFGMFTLAAVGLPIAFAGLAYMLLFGRKLLPGKSDEQDAPMSAREYTTAVRVRSGSPVIGKTVEAAGLRHLPGLFLSRLDRGDDAIPAVAPDEILAEGDVLTFVGALESVVELQQTRGLEPVGDGSRAFGGYSANRKLVEAVVSTSSPLVGQSIRRAGIRTRYGAVVVAVHRLGQRLGGKIGDITLQGGDTLLLEATSGFEERQVGSGDFYLVSARAEDAALRHDRAWLAIGVLAGLVVLISTGLAGPLLGALLAGGAMITLRCCTGPQARSSIDLQVLVTIAAAFGVGKAIADTGLAATIAHAVTDVAAGLGPTALLASAYVLTSVFTMTMTNNAAAVLMFPVAVSIAGDADLPVMPFAVVVAVAASCEFSTPIGYQTNLMVMGPGGYRWLDFTRFGGPLTLLCGAVCVGLVQVLYG
ncbi:MAG: SLC13 family permease [Planctomycetota bacterium]